MNPFAPLLAAGDFEMWMRVALPLLIFIALGIRQLLANVRQVRPPGGAPPQPVQPRPVPRDVADEIGEFLRRAAERRRALNAPPAAAQPPQLPPLPSAEAPVQAEVVATAPVGGLVAQHVDKYLDEQEFGRREVELGKEVAQADKEIDQHLRQVFEHRVSKLEAVPGEAAAPPVAYEPPDLVGTGAEIPATFATGLLDLVSSPDSLRQAIVLNEILHRPEERWG